MSNKTLTRSDICDQLAADANLSRQQAVNVLESILDGVIDGLIEDSIVKIPSFGTFYVRDKNQRVGRNPKTGEEVPILPRRSLSFRASQTFKHKVESAK